MTLPVACPVCWRPVHVAGGRVVAHKTGIYGANGYVDGYDNCPGGGKKLTWAQLRQQKPEGDR